MAKTEEERRAAKKEYARKYRAKNREKVNALARKGNRKYYRKNKEKTLARTRAYYKKNKERMLSAGKRWREVNKQKIKDKNKKYRAVPGVKVVLNIRTRLHRALKRGSRLGKTIKLLGCDILTLRQYLESKFTGGMSWENYGFRGWHVDHIRPCNSFNLTDPEEQKKCFHYTNLQPLWAKDNLSKGKKYQENARVLSE